MICIAEDRALEEVGVRLLIRSAAKWCPDEPVMLWNPCADEDFVAWLKQYPAVTLMPGRLEGAEGWNVKPQALLAALRSGADKAWWIDSDVILTKDFRRGYDRVPSDAFIVAEEALYGSVDQDGARARSWGFDVRRPLPFCLNSGVMRATTAHIPLLVAWAGYLNSPVYLSAQAQPTSDRPLHLLGDQDVLTACLAGPFAEVPLKYLNRGRDIIQYFGPAGYMPFERLRHFMFGLPPFIHSMGADKPWRPAPKHLGGGASAFFNRTYAELSPYKSVAVEFEQEFKTSAWVLANRPSTAGKILRLVGFGSIPLTGLPLAVSYSLLRRFKGMRR